MNIIKRDGSQAVFEAAKVAAAIRKANETVDDADWCTVGSTNMDFRSFENNFEANAFIYGSAAACPVREGFIADMAHCDEVTLPEWRQRPYRHRVVEAYTRIFAPLL